MTVQVQRVAFYRFLIQQTGQHSCNKGIPGGIKVYSKEELGQLMQIFDDKLFLKTLIFLAVLQELEKVNLLDLSGNMLTLKKELFESSNLLQRSKAKAYR
ncbi:hypothetical protein DFO70_11039 [Cytobacillus firmus]|uniref:Uncharacterized protein n=2 Tax=Cytobacillus TaxID=2675230 RepID=A0A366JPK1_CYTFI|nr:hypothetical protein DFO70_11039 [Cytobacillus firmus]TDX40382.1 hypothetical protein DFO72_10950 [Cytobacillus oceanisediminis]